MAAQLVFYTNPFSRGGLVHSAKIVPAPSAVEADRQWLEATGNVHVATAPLLGMIAVRDLWLAHREQNKSVQAYRRSDLLESRCVLMRQSADDLTGAAAS